MNVSSINISFKSAASIETAKKVADVILQYRRPFQKETLSKSDYAYLNEVISKKIAPSIDKANPIPVTIVGFSMKSPNKQKTISDFADRTEYETLEHLNNLTKKIKEVYPYGSDFKIFSDGRLFVGTIYGSSDDAVTKYIKTNKEFLNKLGTDEIKILSIDDFYHNTGDNLRKDLFSDFPIDKEKLIASIETDSFLRLYRQYMRDFYAKDIHTIDPKISCKESRKIGDKIALGVICAAESYDRFINSLYNQPYLRLSVHAKPVYDIKNKIGIFLNKLKENFPTPWHSAAVKITQKDGNEIFIYEKKSLLEKAHCQFIPNIEGKGAYYIFPSDKKYDFSKSFKENLQNNFS